MSFLDDLNEYGPDSGRRASRDEAIAYCARLTAGHYENFSVVTWLTPHALRRPMQAIYAFCRWSDDLGDEVGDRDRATELLAWWRGELASMFAGGARHPVMVALGEVVRDYAIPPAPFEALIAAFEQDQVVLEYETYAQLLDYCTRSANPVGHLVLYLARSFDSERARLSDLTCTGLQLANFWQDVARDYDIGRVYLPREDRTRFGVEVEQVASRRFTEGFAELMRFEVERARALLRAGAALVPLLPAQIAIDVDLFGRGGLAILDRIEAQGFDVLARRPTLSKAAKFRLLSRALAGKWRTRRAVLKTPAPAAAAGSATS